VAIYWPLNNLERIEIMTTVTTQQLQTLWEQLNAALYDIEQGEPMDAVTAIEDGIKILEALGAGK
jgi:hypothetical protein